MQSIIKHLVALVALITMGAATTYAQDSTVVELPLNMPKVSMVYGVLGGLNIPRLSESNKSFSASNGIGFQAGVMMGLKFKRIEIVPELWYSYNRCTISSADGGVSGRLSTNNFEVPILAAIPIGSIFRINIGPTLAIMSNSRLSSESGIDMEFGRLRSTAGWVIGASATLWGNIILDARFNGYFNRTTSIWNETTESASEHKFSNQAISVNIGYRF